MRQVLIRIIGYNIKLPSEVKASCFFPGGLFFLKIICNLIIAKTDLNLECVWKDSFALLSSLINKRPKYI